MRQHVEHDAAAVLRAVVPRRALRRPAVAGEHPIAEFRADRQDAPEEPRSEQPPELADPRQPQFVLHHAVAQAGVARPARQRQRVVGARRRRLLAIDVLAGRQGAAQQRRPRRRRRGVEKHRTRVVERRVEVGRPVVDAVSLRQRFQLRRVATHEQRVWDDAASVRKRDPAGVADRCERTRKMLVRAHAPRRAMHDDADRVAHGAPRASMRGMKSPRPSGRRSSKFHSGLNRSRPR